MMTKTTREEGPGVERVVVVGAGTMGQGIAQVTAEAGIDVTLLDADAASLDRGLTAIAARWQRAIAKERTTAAAVAAATSRLRRGAALDVVAEADLVVEAIIEDQAAKVSLFRDLDRMAAPAAILASNTSSISITRLGAATQRAGRVVGLHFFNPVPVLPLVEVVRGLRTGEETVRRGARFAEALGKTAVVVNDSPGFVANRVLLPMINEAIFCLMEGVAAKEAIDEVMKLGMTHPMGPLALADLIGLDVCLDILETLHTELGDDKYRPAPLLRRLVAAGMLGRKSGEGLYRYGDDV